MQIQIGQQTLPKLHASHNLVKDELKLEGGIQGGSETAVFLIHLTHF